MPKPAPGNDAVDEDIAAAVEAQLAAQRAELTAKLVAEKEARQRKEAEEARAAEEAAKQAASAAGVTVDAGELAKFKAMLLASGVRLMPTQASLSKAPAFIGDEGHDEDYEDTERVQLELHALLDLLGVVRAKDVIEHVRRADGAVMSPANVRYHMRKLANRGMVKKIEERYHLPGLGWRTRDAWSKDPQKLLEILEGKKITRQ